MFLDLTRIKAYDRKYTYNLMSQMGFSLMGNGCHRETYLSPNKKYVLKFPINGKGIDVNAQEHLIWHLYKSKPDYSHGGMVYAPCRLIGGLVLMMWAVTKSFGCSQGDDDAQSKGYIPGSIMVPPAWVERIDCCQAGVLPSGKIVAYDYGSGLLF